VNPEISVVILNYNGRQNLGEQFLASCLSSVLQSSYPNFEVLFVDNGSTDDSVRFVKEHFQDPKLKVIENGRNLGYAMGNNMAVKHARGEYIALLNNDVEVEPSWMQELVKTMENDPTVGIAQSKILSLDRTHIQSVGNLLDTALATHLIGYNQEDKGQYNKSCRVTFASGASLIARRSLIEKIGLFDPAYFFYHDDCDLGLRTQLAGFKVVSVASSVVYHKGQGTSARTLTRNQEFLLLFISRLGLLIKNLELRNLLKFGIRLFVSISMDIFGLMLQGDVRTPIDLIFWTLRNFKGNWKKRLVVQKQIRKVKDDKIFKSFLDSSIFVLRIERHVDRLIGGRLNQSFDKLVNQATDNYYKNHLDIN
jgi:GT2 family glycosyltransferase